MNKDDGVTDFLTITETPGSLLNDEQIGRMALRYSLAAEMAAGRRVLEVSCGAGIGLGLLLEGVRSLAACDYSTAALTLASRSLGASASLTAADAQNLPYRDRAFDLILSFEAIYYLLRPDAFVRECHRLLGPGGRLLISTSNPDWPYFAPGALSVHYPTAPEFANLLLAAGFVVHLYGSLSIDRSAKQSTVLRAWLRRQALRAAFLRRDNWFTRMLKRASYGTLTPLPSLLPASARIPTPLAQLTPIKTNQPDRSHRVIFAVAERC